MIRFFFKGRWELKFGEKCRGRAAYFRMELSEWDQKLTTGQWNDGHYYLPKKFCRDRSLAGRNSLGLSFIEQSGSAITRSTNSAWRKFWRLMARSMP